MQFAYAIGFPDPVSINVNTFGTSTVDEPKIEKAVREVFDFKPAGIVARAEPAASHLLEDDQLRPLRQGGRPRLSTWEKRDKVEALKAAV